MVEAGGQPEAGAVRRSGVTETIAGRSPAISDADEAVTALYAAHYRPLVRLATLLLHDTGAAEEVVQDAFVAMHGGWRRLRDPDKALAYLRQAVVNRARSSLRHRKVVERHAETPFDLVPSAEHGALAAVERAAMMSALRRLPQRQREALVLRYYADLSEAQIADAMGISAGAVKSHASRGIAALRATMERSS
jgi:RNA polymerase sigma-70 factor (sigma-E family)